MYSPLSPPKYMPSPKEYKNRDNFRGANPTGPTKIDRFSGSD